MNLHASKNDASRLGLWRAAAVAAAAALLTLWMPFAQAAVTKCDPTVACCKSADIGGNPGCAGGGNPINVITGNKYQREEDLSALPGVLGIEVVRHYNSATSGEAHTNGVLGKGWRLSYEVELTSQGHTLSILQADGTPLQFVKGMLNPRHYLPVDPADGRVSERVGAQGAEYQWSRLDGRQYVFDSRGRLVQIKAPTGEFVSLAYDARGLLLKVTDPQGRSLKFDYLGAESARSGKRFRGVQSIDTPVGRFDYGHGSDSSGGAAVANLTQVTFPGPDAAHRVRRLYHYEDTRHPTLLTGISVNGTGSDGKLMRERLSTYAYDEQGRGVLTVKGEPARPQVGPDGQAIQPSRLVQGTGIEQVTFDRSKPSRVVATNSLGQTTVFTHAVIAGQARLLEVRGAGCAHCAGPNVRYGYDKLGRLTEVTDITVAGEPIKTMRQKLDTHGRTQTVSRIDYRNGKALPPKLLARYEYPEPTFGDTPANEPTLVARPSVIEGKEHVTRIAYNEAGQPTAVTEEGFSPIDDKGQPSGSGTVIKRVTAYSYSRINGRSVLSAIDGPLANGPRDDPSDSDITRAVWDVSGSYVIDWTTAGNLESTLAYDTNTGFIVKVENSQGVVTEFTRGNAGELVRIATNGPGWTRLQVHSVKYDALGNSTELGVGSDAEGTYRAQARHEFDVAGRPMWSATALGVLKFNRYDTESRLTESGRYSSAIAQVQSYAYDERGRITRVTDKNAATLRIGYDDRGRPLSLTDASGRALEPASGQTDAARRPHALALHDDFGRIVLTTSPDSGTSIHRFDEADRLIASTDAQGNAAAYHYDAAGRIARQRIIDKGTGQTTETHWRYAGQRLVALESPTQSERYEHDERGLLVAKVVTQRQDDGSELTSVTRYGWDADGVLQSVSLPDGSHVRYQRNGQGQVVAVQRSRIQTSWLQWLLPAKTLVKDLQRDLVGLKSYSAGNGIEASAQRSREGTLARIVYRNTRQPPTESIAALRIQDILGVVSAQAAASAETTQTAQAALAPADARLPGALGEPADPRAFIDHRYLWDTQGNLLYSRALAGHSAYAYDARDRLIVANSDTTTSRYHYDASGRRVLSQEGVTMQDDLETKTRKALYQDGTHRWVGEREQSDYDMAGQPSRIGQREYVWDATGRLVEVRQEDRSLARYRYSHRGERIGKAVGSHSTGYLYENRQLTAELDWRGHITRQYVYLADQPIAVIDTPQGRDLDSEDTGAAARVVRDLRIAVNAWFGSDERIVWLHANHLGAIEAATNEQGHIVWQASYQPFGAARIAKGEFVLNLRLPGQYEDAETGLHYNQHRYYDPSRGEYLSPDPLGTPDGPNPYAYVRHNPLRYADPSGLILFAFDGTGNTNNPDWLKGNGSSFSNVWQFRRVYDSGDARYVTGVGTLHHDDQYADIVPPFLDMARNASGVARIERMMNYFNDEADLFSDNEAMDVDIVGFSRGAAEARDFANQVVANTKSGWYSYQVQTGRVDPKTLLPILETHCQKVNFKFMGLWDTVLSNNAGRDYNLSIPDAFAYVAQAVALNEYRGKWKRQLPGSQFGAFPLESIMDGMQSPVPTPGRTRIERGFIGAHGDIGGGFGANENQLAQVALAWMVQQAKLAGVTMKTASSTIIANPVVHDKSDNLYSVTGAPGPNGEDRQVGYRDGSTTTQRQMVFSQGMTYVDTQQPGLISYLPADINADGTVTRAPRADFVTGTVDMRRYLEWLNANGYNINLTVQ